MCMTEDRVRETATVRAVCCRTTGGGQHSPRAKLEPGANARRGSSSSTTTSTWRAGWRGCCRSTVTKCRSPTTGPPGLDKAKKSKPDVVLLDIGLPGMDGYQVAAHLRRDETVKDATLIAISGYGQEEDLRLAKEAGFDHHLVKPIVSDDLIKILEESER